MERVWSKVIIGAIITRIQKLMECRRGEASGFAILLIFLVTGTLAIVSLYKDIDKSMIILQKSRHRAAVERALSDAITSIDTQSAMSLQALALGYKAEKKVSIDLDRFTELFYNSIYSNMKIADDKGKQQELKQNIPMKAAILYDKIYMSGPDDNWYEYDLCHDINGTMVYFSLTDEVYTIDSLGKKHYTSFANMGISARKKQEIFGFRVRNVINDFISIHKNSKDGYYVNITNFDDDKFQAAINDVTFMCLVEGVPIKTLLSDKPDRSFYCFAFGGASIVRKKL